MRDRLTNRLLAEMNAAGHWEGELSSSALATAVAVFALSRVDRQRYGSLIVRGLNWLAAHVNDDGGWGDSPESPSNITTVLLCWAAFSLSDESNSDWSSAIQGAETWLERTAGSTESGDIIEAVIERYSNDRTFAVPILMMCALSGRLGDEPGCWKLVPQLPFELSILPHRLFKALRLTVVSYALPALIAIGYVRYKRCAYGNCFVRWIRGLCVQRALKIVDGMQPENGGYEEAVPLTGFVVMSMVASGQKDGDVVRRGADFLSDSIRDDGSWPIDTNLATWVTTLSIKALPTESLTQEQKHRLREWLLGQQHNHQHPLTYGAAGGWSWTDLPGGMPDADDTPGVLLALKRLGLVDDEVKSAACRGIDWLLDLQNSDGGTPTFSKGWGKLPFDRSCPDVTAHTLWALDEWYDDLPQQIQKRILQNLIKGLGFLADSQCDNGSWVPLWFGCQETQDQENPVYGTARVIEYLQMLKHVENQKVEDLILKGTQYLLSAQNEDGGWGGGLGAGSAIEETALAITALAAGGAEGVVGRGLEWLSKKIDMEGAELPAGPIGLYFAKLWYSERLYPLIFALMACGRGTERR
ncbi:MAG: squalene--hopene cyclase [Kiritimatiellae bacterium]|nr:squalene--hopene cyclase [Kiritimatiellia bacterium]